MLREVRDRGCVVKQRGQITATVQVNDGLGVSLDVITLRAEDERSLTLSRKLPCGRERQLLCIGNGVRRGRRAASSGTK